MMLKHQSNWLVHPIIVITLMRQSSRAGAGTRLQVRVARHLKVWAVTIVRQIFMMAGGGTQVLV